MHTFREVYKENFTMDQPQKKEKTYLKLSSILLDASKKTHYPTGQIIGVHHGPLEQYLPAVP